MVSSPRRGMLCWKELFSFFYTLRILNSVTKNVIALFTLHVNVFAYIYSLSFLPRLIRGFALTIFFLLPVDSALDEKSWDGQGSFCQPVSNGCERP